MANPPQTEMMMMKICQSKLEEVRHWYPESGSLEGQFVDVANLEVQLFCVVVEGHVVGIACFMGGGHHIGHELRADRAVIVSHEVVEAGASVFVDRHVDHVVPLPVVAGVGEVLVIEDAELLVRVLDESERVALGVADSEVDGTCALRLVDGLKRTLDVLRELQEVPGDVGPGLAVPRFILLHRVLLPYFFADARVLAEASDRPNDAGEADIDEGM